MAVARKRVEDAETAIQQEKDDIRSAEILGLTATNLKKTCQEMLNAIRDSLSDHASSDNGDNREDEEDDEEDSGPVKLRKHDEACLVLAL